MQFRRGGLLVATLSAVLYGGLVLAQYLAASGLLHDPWLGGRLDRRCRRGRSAQYTVALNVFGFFAVALLSGSLAESLRSAGARLEQASTEIADLQALNQHVIDSLPSGLATTDPQQRILTFNRAAEAITGVPFAPAVGRPIADVLQLPRAARWRRSTAICAAAARGALEFRYRTGRRPRRDRDRPERDAPARRRAAAPASCSRSRTSPTIKKLERDAAHPAAARGGRRDGRRHRARDPQPARVDVGLDPDPAPGAAAQQPSRSS